MGKSTAAAILRDMGFPSYDADKAVHSLLKKGGKGVAPVARFFPDVIKRDAVDRKALGRAVFGHPKKLRKLEKIIHPLIRAIEKDFLRSARATKAQAAILEIPLLFETGAESRCDVTLCVTAPRAIQKARVLSRPGMTIEKFGAILARQMPDAQKRAMADFTVPTGESYDATTKHLYKILSKLGIGEA